MPQETPEQVDDASESAELPPYLQRWSDTIASQRMLHEEMGWYGDDSYLDRSQAELDDAIRRHQEIERNFPKARFGDSSDKEPAPEWRPMVVVERPRTGRPEAPRHTGKKVIATLAAGLAMTKGFFWLNDDHKAESTAQTTIEDVNTIYNLGDHVSLYVPEQTLEEQREAVDGMTNPRLQKIAEHLLDVEESARAIELASRGSFEAEEARKIAEEIDDDALRRKTERALDRQAAADAIAYADNSYNLYADDEVEGLLDDIDHDPIRRQAEQAVDALRGRDAINETELNYGIRTDKIDETLESIGNERVQDIAEEGVDLAESVTNDEAVADTVAQLEGIAETAEGRFEIAVDRARPDLQQAVYDANFRTSDLTTQVLHKANQVDTPAGAEFTNDINNRESIRPYIVETSAGTYIDTISWEDGEFEQIEKKYFAEFTVEDGELKLERPAEDSVDNETFHQLEVVVDNLKPFIQAGMESGNISRVIFMEGSDSPAYDPVTREIIVPIPHDGTMSMNQLTAALMHETVHALTRPAYAGDVLTEQQFNQFASVCNTLTTNVYDQYELAVSNLAGQVDQLKKYLPESQHIVIDTFRDHLADGTLEEEIITSSVYSTGLGLPLICGAPQFMIMLDDIARYNGIEAVNFSDDAENSDVLVRLMDSWDNVIRNLSVYGQLNEANYIITDDPEKESYGHSADNATELMATVGDIAINFGPEFVQTVRSFPNPADQQAAVEVMRLTFDFMREANPGLRSVLPKYEETLISQIYA